MTAVPDPFAAAAATPSSSLSRHITTADREEEEEFDEDMFEGHNSQLAVHQNLLNTSLRPASVSTVQLGAQNDTHSQMKHVVCSGL